MAHMHLATFTLLTVCIIVTEMPSKKQADIIMAIYK